MTIANGLIWMAKTSSIIFNFQRRWRWRQTSLKKNNGVITIWPSPLMTQPLGVYNQITFLRVDPKVLLTEILSTVIKKNDYWPIFPHLPSLSLLIKLIQKVCKNISLRENCKSFAPQHWLAMKCPTLKQDCTLL